MNFYRITAFVPWVIVDVKAEILKIDDKADVTAYKRGPMNLFFVKSTSDLTKTLNGKAKQVAEGKRPADIRVTTIENEEEFNRQKTVKPVKRFGRKLRNANNKKEDNAEGKSVPRKNNTKNERPASLFIRAPKGVKCIEIHDYFKNTLKANIIAYQPRSKDDIEFCIIRFEKFEDSKAALQAWRNQPMNGWTRTECHVAPARPFWLRKKLAQLRAKRAVEEEKAKTN